MFNHLPPQELPEIKQTNIDGKRHYETPAGTFISITTLLSSQIPQGIIEWRESVGDDVANYVMRMASTRGNKVHEMVESYLSNKPQNDLLDEFGVLASGLFNLMIPALDRIDNICGLEKALFSERLKIHPILLLDAYLHHRIRFNTVCDSLCVVAIFFCERFPTAIMHLKNLNDYSFSLSIILATN